LAPRVNWLRLDGGGGEAPVLAVNELEARPVVIRI